MCWTLPDTVNKYTCIYIQSQDCKTPQPLPVTLGPILLPLFTLHYRPSSKNTKADSLSRFCLLEHATLQPDNILPSSCFINLLTLETDEQIRNSLACHLPENTPEDRTFVSTQLHAHLITWAHITLNTGHPGTQCTYDLLWAIYAGRCSGSSPHGLPVPCPRSHTHYLQENSSLCSYPFALSFTQQLTSSLITCFTRKHHYPNHHCLILQIP